MSTHNTSSELIFGFVCPVGTIVDNVIQTIAGHLRRFNYDTKQISVSKQIISQFEEAPCSFLNEYDRINHYIALGDKLRKDAKDNSILMRGVADLLSSTREIEEQSGKPKKRMAYIINSIKHPHEVALLRQIYGAGFHLIGITSSTERRKNNLINKYMNDEQAKELLSKDEYEEDEVYGQRTRDAFQLSDYFINIEYSTDPVEKEVKRIIDLIFGHPHITPTFNEFAMFMAYTASLRSADLSRQVGAVVTRENEIIATGANDCPKAGGGLYWPNRLHDGSYCDTEDGRDYKVGYDSNKRAQKEIIDSILICLEKEISQDNIRKIKESKLRDITEYGRVVHAEMEALLSCARNNISCKDSQLYVTTFPCHNCAKHIIAAGIKKVIYIEPYPKSKAFDFYKNEICDNESDKNKVQFIHFTGVGPNKFFDLFSVTSQSGYDKIRKNDDGDTINWIPENAITRTQMTLLDYLEIELMEAKFFIELKGVLKK